MFYLYKICSNTVDHLQSAVISYTWLPLFSLVSTSVHAYPFSLLCRGAGAAPGGGGAGASGAGSGRAEEAVPGPDGDSGEAEGRQGAGPRGRRHLYSRGEKLLI